ncbi:MAG: hypothetical protein NT080_12315 [Spirochaetes bacterium]|nr:hypothetical protein [Spirochaetota bacterium]
MRLRNVFKLVNAAAAALALGFFILGSGDDASWIPAILLIAAAAHLGIEAVVAYGKTRYRKRLSDLREFSGHERYSIQDIESALSGNGIMRGVSLHASIAGIVSGDPVKAAPLSGRDSLAYRIEAEILEGLGKGPGPTVTVDSYWSGISVRDDTGIARLSGPGIIDSSGWTERVFSMGTLRSKLPVLGRLARDALGIDGHDERKTTQIRVREIALLPGDEVQVFGTARNDSGGFVLQGNDVLDDPDSILVRSQGRTASSRLGKHGSRAVLLALFAVLSFSAGVFFATRGLFEEGGIFDASRTGAIDMNPASEAFRIVIGENSWDFEGNETGKDIELVIGDAAFKATRGADLAVLRIASEGLVLRNGEERYPRWDGSEWLLAIERTPPPPSTGMGGTGRLYVRNLTRNPVTFRVLEPDGSALHDTSWSFGALEGAGDPSGKWLNVGASGPLQVSAAQRVEIVMQGGSRRLHPMAKAAVWRKSGSWLMEIVPELLGGEGALYVKNPGAAPVRIQLLGTDGKPLYGENPWMFEAKEGLGENLGLKLQFDKVDVSMTGRELIELEFMDLHSVFSGPLERAAAWRDGRWKLDIDRLLRDAP